jgi:membrane protease YdiL (CAAX protease family)
MKELLSEDSIAPEADHQSLFQDVAPGSVAALPIEQAPVSAGGLQTSYTGNDHIMATDDRTGARRSLIWPLLLIIGIMAAIAICEYVFAYKNVAYGILIALALVIILYTVLTVCPLRDDLAASIESITLVPLYILFTSSLPWFFVHQYFLLPAVYSCVLALCWLHINQKQLDLKQIFGAIPGARQLAWIIPTGIVIGGGLGYVEYMILRIPPTYGHLTTVEVAVNTVYMLFFVGLGEELLFRGFIQNDLSRLFGWRWGLFLSSLLFAIMHLTWRSVPELFFVFAAGFIFGWLYLKTKGLYLPIVVHCMDDVVLDAIFPYIIGVSYSYKVQLLVWQWLTSNTGALIYLFRR